MSIARPLGIVIRTTGLTRREDRRDSWRFYDVSRRRIAIAWREEESVEAVFRKERKDRSLEKQSTRHTSDVGAGRIVNAAVSACSSFPACFAFWGGHGSSSDKSGEEESGGEA
jgi:hypothetical protein